MEHSNETKIRLTIWEAVKLLLLFVLYTIAISIIIILISKVLGVNSRHPLLGIFNTIIPLILIVRKINKKSKLSIGNNLVFKKEHIRIIFPLIIIIVGINIVMSEVGNYITAIFPMSESLEKMFREMLGGEISFVGTIIKVVIVAAVAEEIFMRGIILDGLLGRYSEVKSVVISALLFGLWHLNIYQFPAAFVGGLLLGWIFVKTKSLLLCIIGHAVNNSLGFITIKLLNLKIKGYSMEGFQPLWFTSLGLVLLIMGSSILRKRFSRAYINKS